MVVDMGEVVSELLQIGRGVRASHFLQTQDIRRFGLNEVQESGMLTGWDFAGGGKDFGAVGALVKDVAEAIDVPRNNLHLEL